ncbi:cysteine proteinase [Lentithecium fluviatile CBS 122367]|uniref:Ubiquitin carboxyl-terminal hydrolase n=1 Tax=Lentithecium fluviatile CBS 122367 TaxID=1168545 RepID=A0A6G1J565_9PLEO|nr:cysteine proteinase [Lentithecium fluviatile CBS 122367]
MVRRTTKSKAKARAVSQEPSVANSANGASAAAPIETSSSPKDDIASKTVKSSAVANGTLMNNKDTIPTKTVKSSTSANGMSEKHNGDSVKDASIKDTSTKDTSTKDAAAQDASANNTSLKDLSPKSKKRALPEPTVGHEPTSKRSKESPQASPDTTPKQEGSPVSPRFPSPPDQAATEFDKEKWQGYCEIENEPAFFSVILREIGVQGVTVRQVVTLDPDILATMPNPIFGLILLYRHREFDVSKQETACPDNIWFANQMPAQNSCATLAMIHTLLNTDNEDIDIGEHMRQFKDYSMDLSPFHRGQAFASWQFVKKIHNSFAKKMDIYQSDMYLAQIVRKAERTKKLQAAPKSKAAAKAKARRDAEDSNDTDASEASFEDNAHHFITFVPVNGEVWKLDGMDKQPTRMGTYDEERGEPWTNAVGDRIEALMAAGGDTDYSIFAIAQSPLTTLRKEICVADNTIRRVNRRLDALSTDWKGFVPEEDREPPSPTWLGEFTDEQRAFFPVPEDVREDIDGEDLPELLSRRAELVSELRRLGVQYQGEEASETDEDEAAEKRRFDFQPAIKRWLEMLAENGKLEELAARFPAK